jgi:hypothetical protein
MILEIKTTNSTQKIAKTFLRMGKNARRKFSIGNVIGFDIKNTPLKLKEYEIKVLESGFKVCVSNRI